MAAKIVPFVWEACDHEGGEYLDHCGMCAPFWARYPVATTADDVGRKVWIVGDVAYASAQGAHAYVRSVMRPPYVSRETVSGPARLRAPSVAHIPAPGSKDPIARCGARPGTIARAWASTPEHAAANDRRMCKACVECGRTL